MPKRRRTEVEGDTPASSGSGEDHEAIERSEEVWLEDGNIIVQAENHQFKVHRSVLSKHSPVFANLFKVPQPSTEPTIDGCPVVVLHDSAEDIEHVLLALYGDPEYTNVREELSFPAVAAMIRLGRKYEIDHLRDEGLARLKLEFPSDLDDWDALDTDAYTHIAYTGDELNFVVATIKLAHECKIQSILPAIYLLFITMMDDTLETHPDDLPVPYAALRSCVMGRERLMEAALDKILGWRQRVGAIDGCAARKTCQTTSRRLMRDLLKARPDCEDLMETWDEYAESQAGKIRLVELCGPCKEFASKAHGEGRETVWAALPTYFQLPAWEDLKDFED